MCEVISKITISEDIVPNDDITKLNTRMKRSNYSTQEISQTAKKVAQKDKSKKQNEKSQDENGKKQAKDSNLKKNESKNKNNLSIHIENETTASTSQQSTSQTILPKSSEKKKQITIWTFLWHQKKINIPKKYL